jgi:hypothetical protein
MIATLALALLLSQDPKPAAKTVEERLKELADKVEALDRKAAALADENAKLQQKLDESKAQREMLARQPGAVWVKRYGPAVEFTPNQSAEIEELMYGWAKQDYGKPVDAAGWKSREELLRGKLTAEQIPKLARKVREEQDGGVTLMIKSLVRMAKLPLSAEDAFGKVVRPKVTLGEDVLLPAAHPDKTPSWIQICDIVEANLTEVSKDLSESEVESLRKALSTWKPKQR